MKPRRSREDCEKLPAQLLAALRCRPYTILELADSLGFSHATVRDRLRALLVEGHVRYVEVATKGNLGMAHVWHIGEADVAQVKLIADILNRRTTLSGSAPIFQARQETVRQYPVVGRRDPLVAALFGPARGSPA